MIESRLTRVVRRRKKIELISLLSKSPLEALVPIAKLENTGFVSSEEDVFILSEKQE